MSHHIPRLILLLLWIASTIGIAQAQEPAFDSSGSPMFEGRPLSDWIRSVRDRDEDLEMAFAAIQYMGPRAYAAVPELTKILNEPFVGIRIGIDDDDAVRRKLWNFQLRTDAVESLAAIGNAAAPAAASLIKWALAKRVIPENIRDEQDYNVFVDLVSLDVLERMRVVAVISAFRLQAAEPLLVLLNSTIKDERKLAVGILQEHAIPIAAELLKSKDCAARKLGVTIFVDMWSVVSTDHLMDLKPSEECAVASARRR